MHTNYYYCERMSIIKCPTPRKKSTRDNSPFIFSIKVYIPKPVFGIFILSQISHEFYYISKTDNHCKN